MIDYEKATPRNDNVLIRIKLRKQISGLHVAQNSSSSKIYEVVAIGDTVKGLTVGDQIMMTGVQNVDWALLPASNDMLIAKEGNILCILPKQDEGEE